MHFIFTFYRSIWSRWSLVPELVSLKVISGIKIEVPYRIAVRRWIWPLHNAQSALGWAWRGARTPQGCWPLHVCPRKCYFSMIPGLSTLPFQRLCTHLDSESVILPDSCIVATQGPIVDLAEVCVVQNVSMVICEGFSVHTDGLPCVGHL